MFKGIGGNHQVKPLFLQPIDDYFEYLIWNGIKLFFLTFSIDRIQPFLVWEGFVLAMEIESWENDSVIEPCSSMSYSTWTASSLSSGSAIQMRTSE